jgi:hypothetical protein
VGRDGFSIEFVQVEMWVFSAQNRILYVFGSELTKEILVSGDNVGRSKCFAFQVFFEVGVA